MPYTDTNTQLVLNVLTQQQYDEITTKEENQVYLITDASGNTGDYLPLTGGTLTGRTDVKGTNYNISLIPDDSTNTNIRALIGDPDAQRLIVSAGNGISEDTSAMAQATFVDGNAVSKINIQATTTGSSGIQIRDNTNIDKVSISTNSENNGLMTITGSDSTSTTNGTIVVTGGVGVSGNIYATNVYGAVWNDFAEFREGPANVPGYVLSEVGDDTIELSTRRLQPGSMICSDTYGFAIGETSKAITPVAVAGRVLAYPMEDREVYRNHIGEFVGASEDGRVTLMTKEEVRDNPESIIGTVSAVPDYEEWGAVGRKVPVNGRIWIKVK